MKGKKTKKIVKKEGAGMFIDLDRVLEQVGKDKGIPKEILISSIEEAMLAAARKKYGLACDVEAHYNPEVGEIELFQFKTVVEEIEDEDIEVNPKQAKQLDPDAEIGDSLGVKLDARQFGRIAAMTAKQVIIQKVRDAERDIVFREYKDRVGELMTGTIRRIEKGNYIVDVGRTEAIIPVRHQVKTETYHQGDRVQAYFLEIDREARGPQIVLSRRDKGLLIKLFELEVPEIAEGIVTIKNSAREPGARSKIAVYSKDSDVDPVGACVGMKGSRVQSVVQEMRGEKIDIVAWDTDSAKFVCNAISPAEVTRVIMNHKNHTMEVVVPDDQLSLAIGKKGQNVRLAAQLVGWTIDVYSESKLAEMAGKSKAALVAEVGVDESLATILYNHGFRSPAEIAEATPQEIGQIPGLSEKKIAEVKSNAEAAVKRAQTAPSNEGAVENG